MQLEIVRTCAAVVATASHESWKTETEKCSPASRTWAAIFRGAADLDSGAQTLKFAHNVEEGKPILCIVDQEATSQVTVLLWSLCGDNNCWYPKKEVPIVVQNRTYVITESEVEIRLLFLLKIRILSG